MPAARRVTQQRHDTRWRRNGYVYLRETCSDNTRWKCEHTGADVTEAAPGVFPLSRVPEMWECEDTGEETPAGGGWAENETLAASCSTGPHGDDSVLTAIIPHLNDLHTRSSSSLDVLLSRQICSHWAQRNKSNKTQDSSFWIHHFLWYHLCTYGPTALKITRSSGDCLNAITLLLSQQERPAEMIITSLHMDDNLSMWR